MKKFIVLFVLLTLVSPSFAASINPAAYRTMQMQAYRNNYTRRQMNNRAMPYWQAQSNYATRNRTYTNYQNYSNYENAVNQYNYERSGRRY